MNFENEHFGKEDTDEFPILSYNNGSRFLTVDFQPEKICMMPSTGRIYHPGPEKTGGIGLLSDKLGIMWTTVRIFFIFIHEFSERTFYNVK